MYLALQWEDTTRDKGLTRLSYEALVKAALRATDSENRLPLQEVRDRVVAMLSPQTRATIEPAVDSALKRMKKRAVRHWPQSDEYCLTFEEQQRVQGRLAEFELQDGDFENTIQRVLLEVAADLDFTFGDTMPAVAARTKAIIDGFILEGGEAFASAVVSGDLKRLDIQALTRLVIADVADAGAANDGKLVRLLIGTVEQLIQMPDEAVQSHLRRSTDAYTLLAFLRAVPDVQRVVAKLFSHGRVWLDTSIVLPAMAETLLPEEQQRFSSLLRLAGSVGLELRITPGVVEEVERHIHRSLVCQRSPQSWVGRLPFMLSVYTASGRALADYPQWIEHFVGGARREDDIVEYLSDVFDAQVEALDADAEGVDEELRWAVQEVWHAAHERRRGEELDPVTLNRLIAHDVDNYVGVIARRKRERVSPFGYTSWWLTLDPTAFAARGILKEQLVGRVPDSPVLSPDFLANYLALGPVRGRVDREAEEKLPIIFDLGVQEMPTELLALATEVRVDAAGLSERVIQRRVRDGIDRVKRRRGPIAEGGVRNVEAEIRRQLMERKKRA